jgi:putative ABC transport system permease protein
MIKNYFKVAWRNLLKNKVFSVINVGGLAAGMFVSILIGLWIYDELSFNKNFENYDSIAKVTKRAKTLEGKPFANPWLPMVLAGELKATYGSYFKHVILATEIKESILTADEKKLSKTGQFIEAGAPDMLSLQMLRGSRLGLSDPHSVLLSASTARALFGDEDPINRMVKINADMDAKVTGVYRDFPRNSEFNDIQFLAPFELFVSVNPWMKEQGWNNHFVLTYVQLKPRHSFDQVSAAVKDAEFNRIKDIPALKKQAEVGAKVWLLPMKDWHLRSDIATNAPAQLVRMIGLIGVFVLLLACINFMNLSTARSEKRAREVGIRKTIGSLRIQLVRQFFSESLLLAFLSFILAIIFIVLFLPFFNGITAKQMAMPLTNFYFWLFSLLFITLTGLIAGSYPALYLSSFKPVKVLKGTFRVGRFAAVPRKVLVVVQFTVSVALIISTIIVYQQINYVKDRPVGYDRTGLLQIKKKSSAFYGTHELLRNELMRTGVVYETAESRSSVTSITMWNGGFYWKGRELSKDGCGTLSVSAEYGKTIGWEVINGRDFSSRLSNDSSGLVVNESFAKLIGIPNPVGEVLKWDPGWRPAQDYLILGVVKDMVAISPYEPAIPTVYLLDQFYLNDWINIRLKPGVSMASALGAIESVFKKVIPSAPFDYKFADQEYALKFAAEERVGKLALFFAILAIFISALGLFGLASFMAEQRTKEIGIRKVLGASVANLWRLLSRDFVMLVVIALLIAVPISYYFMHRWLENYQYRTEISWWVFVVAGVSALLITILTVSFQAVKAALINPIRSLRTE